MKKSKLVASLAVASAILLPSMEVSAQTLFSDNFDLGLSGTTWNVNLGAGNNAANLAFDYNTIGIPSAPNSAGTTIGVKLEANFGPTTGNIGGVSISPIGGNFIGNYLIKYDMWINFNGELSAGGSGSTQLTGAGFGSTGSAAITVGSPSGGVWFGATGDGGNGDSPGDYRAYVNGAALATTTGAYYAGTQVGARNDLDAYYQNIGGVSAPAAQVTLFAQQINSTRPGAAGMQWQQMTISVTNGFANYNLDGLDIAKVDLTGATLPGNNIFLLHSDINTGLSTDPNRRSLAFGLIDNVRVEVVPEPSTIALGILGMAGLFFARRRK